MNSQPNDKQELIDTLRQLVAVKPQSLPELKQLETLSVEVARHAASELAGRLEIPESVWHFLADPDIRYKDPSYAAVQLAELEQVLARWQDASAA